MLLSSKRKLLLLTFYFLVILSIKVENIIGDEFPPEKHVKSKIDDTMNVKLVLDEQSQLRMNSIDQSTNFTPVVFWHGMGDTAYGSINIDRIALQTKFPGMMIFSIQIGENPLQDELAGYFVNVNYQIDKACDEIINNDIIKSHGSFNAVGFSQGSQFLRGLIQRCPFDKNGIKVKNYISLGGQHQGVYGLPDCTGPTSFICEHIKSILTSAAYERNVQEHVVQAEYWHDPNREEEYKEKNIFLADINNERIINQTYKNNLLQLDNLVLIEFLKDSMVIPRESSLFGFYAPGQTKTIIPLEKSSIYLEDRIGLKKLKETGRLHMIQVPGNHLQYKMKWFLQDIASKYLDN